MYLKFEVINETWNVITFFSQNICFFFLILERFTRKMYIFIKAILIVSLGLLFSRFLRRQKIAAVINKMPGPPTLPILGNLLLVLGNAGKKLFRKINI